MINSQAPELLFFNALQQKNPLQQTNASACSGTIWNTFTCIHARDSQGIWPGVDYTDVNSIDRSHNGTILATGDDFGGIKLFKFPCIEPKAQFVGPYKGHSSHVTKVKFTANDQLLVTTGGNDKTVFVWDTSLTNDSEFDRARSGQTSVEEYQAEVAIDAAVFDNLDDLSAINKQQMKETQRKALAEAKEEYKGQHAEEDDELDGGDQFQAVLPWIGQIAKPSNYPAKSPVNIGKPPLINVNLDWIHGYCGSNNRNNLSVVGSGESLSLVYHAASVGICYNPQAHLQRFFQGFHNNYITCIAFSPDGQSVATGERVSIERTGDQRGKRRKLTQVFIWDAASMQMKFKLTDASITQTIVAVAFSPDGSLLGVCDASPDGTQNLAVYNTFNGICVAKGIGLRGGAVPKASNGRTQIVEPTGKFRHMAFRDNQTFVCIGPTLFKEFTIQGSTLNSVMGKFAAYDQQIVSLAFNGPTALTGAASGVIHQWTGTTITGQIKQHTGVVDAIQVVQKNGIPTYVFTGGRDSKICVFDATPQSTLLFSIDCNQLKGSVSNLPRAFAVTDTQLFVGTFGSEIWKLNLDMVKKTATQPQMMISGHFAPLRKDNNEAWGLSVFKNSDYFVTVSDDSTLRLWDTIKHKIECWISLKEGKDGPIPVDKATGEASHSTMGRAVDVDPQGKRIAVGMRDGSLRIYSVTRSQTSGAALKLVFTHAVSSGLGQTKMGQKKVEEWIEDLKFSPDGKKLIVGSHDNSVYHFSTAGLDSEIRFVKKFGKGSSYITHLDWTIDSEKIRTNDGSYEVLYYNVEQGKQLTGGASGLKDAEWATNTCVLTWGTQGIWQPGMDGTDINHCDLSNQPVFDGLRLLATAEDTSRLNVYRWPNPEKNATPLECKGHASHVTKAKWSRDDKFIFTLGGNDTTTIQWKVTPKQA